MTHYVCTGDCGGAADHPGVCQAEGCSKEGEPLVSCTCEDNMHEEAKTGPVEEKIDDDDM